MSISEKLVGPVSECPLMAESSRRLTVNMHAGAYLGEKN